MRRRDRHASVTQQLKKLRAQVRMRAVRKRSHDRLRGFVKDLRRGVRTTMLSSGANTVPRAGIAAILCASRNRVLPNRFAKRIREICATTVAECALSTPAYEGKVRRA